MFGQHDNTQHDDNQIPDHSIDGAMSDGHDQPHAAAGFGHPGTPIGDAQQPPQDNNPPAQVVTPGGAPSSPNPAANHHATHEDSTPAASTPTQSDNTPHELIDIKQKALSQLSPLVGHLEQSPEEKFRTTMMMIQASDDQGLIQVAYEAAGQIQDEKVRAQALLDIVNEINYFTQQHHQ